MPLDFPSTPSDGDIYEQYKWNDAAGVWELNLPVGNDFTPMEGSGGTEVTSGGYKYHTFTSSDTFTVTKAGSCEALIIAGGGAGGGGAYAAGGGAGGLFEIDLNLAAGSYDVLIGAGGTSYSGNYPSVNDDGTDGNNSSFGEFVAEGGGRGGCHTAKNYGNGGGSGGGSTRVNTGADWPGGSGISFQGNDGGQGPSGTYYSCGGGGGAGAPGSDGNGNANTGGNGGIGIDYSAWASATSTGESGYYAGGGGGNSEPGGTYGTGGLGGGGDAGVSGQAGAANTGGGGGGWGGNAPRSNGGGSGIVIVRYAV